MPSPARFTAVPCTGEWPDAFDVSSLPGHSLWVVAEVAGVVLAVLFNSDTDEVGWVVVRNVVVEMVDVMARRDFRNAIDVHPDFFVESLDPTLFVGDPRGEIAAIRLMSGVRVPSELDAFEDDRFNTLVHETSLSP